MKRRSSWSVVSSKPFIAVWSAVLGLVLGIYVGLQVDLNSEPDWAMILTAFGVVASFSVVVVALIPIFRELRSRRARQSAVRSLLRVEIERARYRVDALKRGYRETADTPVPLVGLVDRVFEEVLTLKPIEIEILSHASSCVEHAWTNPNGGSIRSAEETLEVAIGALDGEFDNVPDLGEALQVHAERKEKLKAEVSASASTGPSAGGG